MPRCYLCNNTTDQMDDSSLSVGNDGLTSYEKYCSKCGNIQPIVPISTFSEKDGQYHTWGYCYEKLHKVTTKPFSKKYEAEN